LAIAGHQEPVVAVLGRGEDVGPAVAGHVRRRRADAPVRGDVAARETDSLRGTEAAVAVVPPQADLAVAERAGVAVRVEDVVVPVTVDVGDVDRGQLREEAAGKAVDHGAHGEPAAIVPQDAEDVRLVADDRIRIAVAIQVAGSDGPGARIEREDLGHSEGSIVVVAQDGHGVVADDIGVVRRGEVEPAIPVEVGGREPGGSRVAGARDAGPLEAPLSVVGVEGDRGASPPAVGVGHRDVGVAVAIEVSRHDAQALQKQRIGGRRPVTAVTVSEEHGEMGRPLEAHGGEVGHAVAVEVRDGRSPRANALGIDRRVVADPGHVENGRPSPGGRRADGQERKGGRETPDRLVQPHCRLPKGQ
jgi:hypothetical protein